MIASFSRSRQKTELPVADSAGADLAEAEAYAVAIACYEFGNGLVRCTLMADIVDHAIDLPAGTGTRYDQPAWGDAGAP